MKYGYVLYDPQIQTALNDPELKKTIDSGNIQALMNHPAFLKLLTNPKIMVIQKEIVSGNKKK